MDVFILLALLVINGQGEIRFMGEFEGAKTCQEQMELYSKTVKPPPGTTFAQLHCIHKGIKV